MRSAAHFKAHPIHPALIPFPFAFLTGALLFDVAGLILDRGSFHQTAAHLGIAGVASGLLAAVPGAVDYLQSVPPRSSAKSRALRHALGNVTALVLFAAAWWLRGPDGGVSTVSLAAETLGGAVLAYSASLGGTLVTRNMISVDHRYAAAGKWQEQQLTGTAGDRLALGPSDMLGEDQMRLLHLNGRRIVLARTGGAYRAFDDGCSHRGGSLAGGVCIRGTVQCLWHGSQFDTRTGAVTCGPARAPIQTYEVREEDGKVFLVAP
jgi:nitrite reductase/ring-hydroxylating ferredoxin subunit/uncharacterized membrane protein